MDHPRNGNTVKLTESDARDTQRSVEVLGTILPVGVGPIEQDRGDYIVYLRLLVGGFTLKKARTRPNAGSPWGEFFPMPWVKRNCFTDCDTCYKNHNYQPILSSVCTNKSFQLELHFQNDQQPDKWGQTLHDINPDCKYVGQVECVQ